jgi:hypothetical protein
MNTETKQVNYRGSTYEVPTWVNFIATDVDGEIYGYEDAPQIDKYEDTWYGGLCRLISKRPTDWRQSLERV